MSEELQTISPDQVAKTLNVPEGAYVLVAKPGAPLQAVPYEQLLIKLIKTDLVKASEAALLLDLAWDEDSVALVNNDPVALKNGWWRKVGAAGAGTWSQFEVLAKAAKDSALDSAAQSQDWFQQSVAAYADVRRIGQSALQAGNGTVGRGLSYYATPIDRPFRIRRYRFWGGTVAGYVLPSIGTDDGTNINERVRAPQQDGSVAGQTSYVGVPGVLNDWITLDAPLAGKAGEYAGMYHVANAVAHSFNTEDLYEAGGGRYQVSLTSPAAIPVPKSNYVQSASQFGGGSAVWMELEIEVGAGLETSSQVETRSLVLMQSAANGPAKGLRNVCEGSSLIAGRDLGTVGGSNVSMPRMLERHYGTPVSIFAQGGRTVTEMRDAAATGSIPAIAALVAQGYTTVVQIDAGGTAYNQMNGSLAETPETCMATLRQHLAAHKAANPTVPIVLINCAQRWGDSHFTAAKGVEFNALLAAELEAATPNFEVLVDAAAIPELVDYTNPAYYLDQVHRTGAIASDGSFTGGEGLVTYKVIEAIGLFQAPNGANLVKAVGRADAAGTRAANSAALSEAAAGLINYSSQAEGEGATVEGERFGVDVATGIVDVYVRTASGSDRLRRVVSGEALELPGGMAMLGTASGLNGQQALDAKVDSILLASENGSDGVGTKLPYASAVIRTQGDRNRDAVSIFDFMSAAQKGAVRDGNFMVEMSTVLNAAMAEGLPELLLPPGGYYIEDALRPASGMTLRGVPGQSIIRHATTNVGIDVGLTDKVSLLGLSLTTGTGLNEWSDENDATQHKGSITDDSGTANYLTVDRCYIYDSNYMGVILDNGGIAHAVTNSRFIRVGRDAVDIRGGRGHRLIGLHAENTGDDAFVVTGSRYDPGTGMITELARDVIIAYCVAHRPGMINLGGSGIRMGAIGGQIIGNAITQPNRFGIIVSCLDDDAQARPDKIVCAKNNITQLNAARADAAAYALRDVESVQISGGFLDCQGDNASATGRAYAVYNNANEPASDPSAKKIVIEGVEVRGAATITHQGVYNTKEIEFVGGLWKDCVRPTEFAQNAGYNIGRITLRDVVAEDPQSYAFFERRIGEPNVDRFITEGLRIRVSAGAPAYPPFYFGNPSETGKIGFADIKDCNFAGAPSFGKVPVTDMRFDLDWNYKFPAYKAATIVNGTTSIAVAHGLPYAPHPSLVKVTPRGAIPAGVTIDGTYITLTTAAAVPSNQIYDITVNPVQIRYLNGVIS